MKTEARDKTKNVPLQLSNIAGRVFIVDELGNEIWVSTSYGELKLGVVGGCQYKVRGGQLVELEDHKVGVLEAAGNDC